MHSCTCLHSQPIQGMSNPRGPCKTAPILNTAHAPTAPTARTATLNSTHPFTNPHISHTHVIALHTAQQPRPAPRRSPVIKQGPAQKTMHPHTHCSGCKFSLSHTPFALLACSFLCSLALHLHRTQHTRLAARLAPLSAGPKTGRQHVHTVIKHCKLPTVCRLPAVVNNGWRACAAAARCKAQVHRIPDLVHLVTVAISCHCAQCMSMSHMLDCKKP